MGALYTVRYCDLYDKLNLHMCAQAIGYNIMIYLSRQNQFDMNQFGYESVRLWISWEIYPDS